MRLYDRIKAKINLPDMPVIVADEIARQYDDLPLDGFENDSFPADWYGNVAPPFGEFWVESRTFDSRYVHSKETITIERGVWAKIVNDDEPKELLPNARWTLKLTGFQWFSILSGEYTFEGFIYVGIREDGQLLFDDARWVGSTSPDYVKQALGNGFPRNQIFPIAAFRGFVIFFLKAINAMHQRVEVAEVTPTRQMSRLSERKHGIKLNKYYLLKVKPYELKSIEDFKLIGKPDKMTRREHEVRGHFRYYHPDKPLFGRAGLTGMIWVPDHTRGNHELGIVEKGYEVTA